ncbi:MAG: hypothetical protein Tsb0034_08320 [Ekhidna sp.]
MMEIDVLFEEINALATSVPCEDESLWRFVEYGSKSCGGPIGYIAYSTQINTAQFLSLIERHQRKQQAFNVKWNVTSDCKLELPPSSITCSDGKPVLEYN